MIPVIISGGSGTRLWPVSRASYPKQFCEFYDHTFLETTINRLSHFASPHILTVESMRSLTGLVASKYEIPLDNQIYEPFGKNTGPAIALLCHKLLLQGYKQEVVGVFPADHFVFKEQAFIDAVELASQCAQQGFLTTIGIQPSGPETGFGYIELEKNAFAKHKELNAMKVKSFREKPDKPTAQKFLDEGNFYWNAGMFLFRLDVLVEQFQKLHPDMWEQISKIEADMSNAKYIYANLESISFDYAIAENLKDQVCVPCDMGWSDVGSWDELARLSEEVPSLKSYSMASVFSDSSYSNYVFSIKEKVVGLVGVEGLIVVDTPDSLLIAKRGETQKVKSVLEQIKEAGLSVAIDHPFEKRPWGGFEILCNEAFYKVKKIYVNPGQRLSYQSHESREENWVVVEGTALVTLDDKDIELKKGDQIHIKRKQKHRIKNVGHNDLVFVEVQTGDYFGEDDITRYQDDYQRK